MSKIVIVIEREYLERVKKKSFIFTTLLMPVLMLGLMAMPALIMNYVDSSVTSVLVIDNNGLIAPKLTDTPEIRFTDNSSLTIDSALTRTDVDAVLVIPHNIISSRRSSLQLFSNGPSSYTAENAITSQINKIVENERLKQHNIADLDSILADVNSSVAISTVRNDRDSEDSKILSSGVSYGIGIGMSFVLYMFLLIYGQMVMTSIIEEKSNRVLEVVVSSVKPMQLMMGKIIGVALVAVTQMILWGILLVIMSAWVLPAIIPAESMADITALRAGNLEAVSTTGSIDMVNVLASLTQAGNILGLIGMMTVFLVLGFLIYSSIFAAIGSAVDNIQDASQMTSFAVFPIIFGLIFALIAAADPMGSIAFWASLFPLTAPMVMVARIPFDIPAWEIWLSLSLLLLSFIAMVWIAGKIYRIGIFMYGKKPSLKEIIRWISYK
ncbi:ABC transporter permease [uncultured Duncaniella sp.]|uniref:ABC transporter permease n=1 Tax=uncultured Duncaniella sp. TaxID=2768039 RepID=UPI0025AA29F5|nr:ABC transporter permease [uncultured Duncaniella sp.]